MSSSYYSQKLIWKVIYKIWPPILRLMEFLGIHNLRDEYLLGHLATNYTKEDFAKFLSHEGFEPTILAWKNPGEILGMRKLDTAMYQYHIRLFKDQEIRCHYEYSPEAKPVGHFLGKVFNFRRDFFEKLLERYLA